MRSGGFKTFWISFWLTAAVLVPLMGGVVLLSRWQSGSRADVAESKTDVAVRLPKTENTLTALVCVSGEQPGFVLVYLDAGENVFRLAAMPAESTVLSGAGTATLAESYAAAGPARCAELLAATLDTVIPHYLAVSPDTLAEMLEELGAMRTGLSGALTPAQLERAGQSGAVQEWTAATAHEFLTRLGADGGKSKELCPPAAASARGALWQAFLRQKLEALPAALPALLRTYSARLLTNLSATDLYTLGATLEFLANGQAEIESTVLPGDWNAAAGRYEFSDATLAAVQAFFSAAAASAQSAVSSAP